MSKNYKSRNSSKMLENVISYKLFQLEQYIISQNMHNHILNIIIKNLLKKKSCMLKLCQKVLYQMLLIFLKKSIFDIKMLYEYGKWNRQSNYYMNMLKRIVINNFKFNTYEIYECKIKIKKNKKIIKIISIRTSPVVTHPSTTRT